MGKIKKEKNIGKIATKLMAVILAGMMILSVAGTLIYYFIYMAK